VVGDGLNLAFKDRRARHTKYRACWHKVGGGPQRCWRDRIVARDRWDRIFTAAPPSPGKYRVVWKHRHHDVARWWFQNGVGD
jgi:hypothetical protein